MTSVDAVRKAVAFIEGHLGDDIGVRDVADAVCYSQFYFSRQFSAVARMSVYDYLLRRRLTEARKALLAGPKKIVDVAFAYGFASHEVFTRAFFKLFGENPSEASAPRPLAMLEPIGERYLQFLSGLDAQAVDEPMEPRSFAVAGASEESDADCQLILLDGAHRLARRGALIGRLEEYPAEGLRCGLAGLRRRMRFHCGDMPLCLRFYFERVYDPNELAADYLLLQRDNGCLTIAVPLDAAHPQLKSERIIVRHTVQRHTKYTT